MFAAWSISLADAASESKFIEGLQATAETGAGYALAPKPMEAIAKVVGSALAAWFAAITFLGLMIYAGFTWMLARGNAQEVERAKNIIIYAVIGLAVVLGAYVLTKLAVILWEKVL